MADEARQDGLIAADEIVDTPVRVLVDDREYALKILDFEDLPGLVQEIKARQIKRALAEAKDSDDIEKVRERFKFFDLNVDGLAGYCFTLEGIPHLLEASLRKSGHSPEDAKRVAKVIIRMRGVQGAAAIAGSVSGLFAPDVKQKRKQEGGADPT